MNSELTLRIVYAANILVAGWIGVSSLFAPRVAAVTVFSGAYSSHEAIRLVGCLWLGIAALSVAGLFKPIVFSPVLLLQLVYKSLWLLGVAIPAWRAGQVFPVAMAWFFVVWVAVLPFVIPWQHWWNLRQ
jgi:hypothetical protein